MICVTITRETNTALRTAWEAAAEAGAKLVELRLDYLTEPVDWKLLARNKPTPVLITARRTIDGGRWSENEEKRRTLLLDATTHGVDWIDVEEDIAGAFPRNSISRRVISFHDMIGTPEELDAIADRCASGDSDLVKIAVRSSGIKDSFRLLQALKNSSQKRPTTALAMGDWGQFTRIVNAVHGENWTYASWDSAEPPAPGMLSFEQLKMLYHYESINHTTSIYAVIGDPVGHSKSPLIHNLAFQTHQINAVYVPVRVAPDDLSWFMQRCGYMGFRGLSVTIPHKEEIIRDLDDKSALVALTGSCNTVVIQEKPESGKFTLTGENSDLSAALTSLTESMPEKQRTLNGKKVLLLGAGGVARSLAYGLKQAGADLCVVNRTAQRAEMLAAETGAQAELWEDRHKIARQSEIVINCTSLGMSPRIEESPLEPDAFSKDQVVFDTIYIPEWTKFLSAARTAGSKTLSGVDMFIRQAAVQSKLFSQGKEPPTELMADSLRASFSNQ